MINFVQLQCTIHYDNKFSKWNINKKVSERISENRSKSCRQHQSTCKRFKQLQQRVTTIGWQSKSAFFIQNSAFNILNGYLMFGSPANYPSNTRACSSFDLIELLILCNNVYIAKIHGAWKRHRSSFNPSRDCWNFLQDASILHAG